MTDDFAEPDLAADLAFALELADIADRVALERFRAADLEISTKPDRTFVTESDLAVEQAIRARITQARPSDSILGEEFGTEGTSARQWVLDPIDGTSNFLRGVPIWGALIALVIDDEPVVGVASMPALHRRWWAARELGAWTNDIAALGETNARRIRVSGVADLSDASLSFQSIAQWRDAGHLDSLLHLAEAVWRDRCYGDLWSYMLLAEGLLDIVGEFDVKKYDLAALVPIVEEAGGRFTGIAGERGHWHGSALATNRLLHDQVLALITDEHAPR